LIFSREIECSETKVWIPHSSHTFENRNFNAPLLVEEGKDTRLEANGYPSLLCYGKGLKK